VVTLEFTGAQLRRLFEEQWIGEHDNMLQISGMTYRWDGSKPLGERVVGLQVHDQPVEIQKKYSVAITSYLAAGGSQFKVIKETRFVKEGVVEVNVLVDYLRSLPQPVHYQIEGRAQRIA
jgi:5'-nucleotidase